MAGYLIRIVGAFATLAALSASGTAFAQDAPPAKDAALCTGTDALGRTIRRACPVTVTANVAVQLSADDIAAMERGEGAVVLDRIGRSQATPPKRENDPRGKPQFGFKAGPFGSLGTDPEARERRAADPLRQR